MICLDEMGPEAAKSYRGQEVVRPSAENGADGTAQPGGRAKQEIDYGRRGKGYVFGAFRPMTGDAFTQPYTGRTSANWVDFLERVEAWLPAEAEQVYAIVDNLSTHRTTDVLLFSLAQSSALGVRVPAKVRRLPELDRAVVEDLALARAQRAPLRDVGGHLASGQAGDSILEQAQASISLGPPAAPSTPSNVRDRADTKCLGTCRMNH